MDTYDRTSKLKIGSEDLDQAKFKKNGEKIAVRIGNEGDEPLNTIEGIGIPEHDRVDITYPTTSSEVFTYSLSAVQVMVITVTYLSAAKKDITSVVRS